jgi:cytochrome c biogenesis protein
VKTSSGLVSAYPGPLNPTVTLLSFKGDLGLDNGTPQSVYQLNTGKLQKIKGAPHTLKPKQWYTLPGHAGKVQFTGYKHWASVAVTYDPGRVPALCAAVAAIIGLLLGLLIRRRRFWVRATRGADGRTLVEAGGLTRTDAGGTFGAEFEELTTRLRARTGTAPDSSHPTSQGKE